KSCRTTELMEERLLGELEFIAESCTEELLPLFVHRWWSKDTCVYSDLYKITNKIGENGKHCLLASDVRLDFEIKISSVLTSNNQGNLRNTINSYPMHCPGAVATDVLLYGQMLDKQNKRLTTINELISNTNILFKNVRSQINTRYLKHNEVMAFVT
ncbi:hypothetical protein L9F63_016592, partial [Diploptera punctata]